MQRIMTVTSGVQPDIETCRRAFAEFDKNSKTQIICEVCIEGALLVLTYGSLGTDSGTIDVRELRCALQALGHFPSEEELYVMMGMVLPVTSPPACS